MHIDGYLPLKELLLTIKLGLLVSHCLSGPVGIKRLGRSHRLSLKRVTHSSHLFLLDLMELHLRRNCLLDHVSEFIRVQSVLLVVREDALRVLILLVDDHWYNKWLLLHLYLLLILRQ